MWRLRRAVAASFSCIGQVRNAPPPALARSCGGGGGGGFGIVLREETSARAIVYKQQFRNMATSTKARRVASAADEDSASEEFSESDELEQESQELGGMDDMEQVEGKKQGVLTDEEEEEHEAEEHLSKHENVAVPNNNRGAARTFGRPESSMSPKELEVWSKVMALPRGEKVMPILLAWKEEGNDLSARFLAIVVGKLQRMTRFGYALEIVQWMLEEDSYSAFWSTLKGSAIECMARCKGLQAAEKYFNSLSANEKTKTVCETMLAQLVGKGIVPRAESVFQEMEKAGFVSGSTYTLNLMMRLYKQKKLNKKFQEMLDRAKSLNVEPDIHTYNVLLSLKAAQGDLEGMEKVLEEIKSNPGINPDPGTYVPMTRAYIKAGHMDKAELYLLRLENGPFKKNKRTWEIMMELYAELGKKEEVDRMWSRSKSIPGDGAAGYLNYMYALAKLGDTDRVEAMFKRIDGWRKTKSVDEKRHNMLALAYATAGNTSKVEEIESKMKEAGMTITKRNTVVSNKKTDKQPAGNSNSDSKSDTDSNTDSNSDSKSDTESKSKSKSKSKKKKKNKKEKAAAADGSEESSALSESALDFAKRLADVAEEGNVKDAELIFTECRKQKLSDVGMWNKLLQAYSKAEMPAYGFLQRMAADKVKPNTETTELLQKMDSL